jgi:hypothetical protein
VRLLMCRVGGSGWGAICGAGLVVWRWIIGVGSGWVIDGLLVDTLVGPWVGCNLHSERGFLELSCPSPIPSSLSFFQREMVTCESANDNLSWVVSGCKPSPALYVVLGIQGRKGAVRRPRHGVRGISTNRQRARSRWDSTVIPLFTA